MKTLFLILVCAATALAVGCTIISSDSKTSQSGKEVTDSTLAQLEVGKTTRAWLEATLGAPSSSRTVDDHTEIISYTSTRTTTRKGRLILVFRSNRDSEEKETVYFEFRDGILNNYWKST